MVSNERHAHPPDDAPVKSHERRPVARRAAGRRRAPARSSAVPVAESQFEFEVGLLRLGMGDHRRHRGARAPCSSGTGIFGVRAVQRRPSPTGMLHTKTNTESSEPRQPRAKRARRVRRARLRRLWRRRRPSSGRSAPHAQQHARARPSRRPRWRDRPATARGSCSRETASRRSSRRTRGTPARLRASRASRPAPPRARTGRCSEKTGNCRPTIELSSVQIEAGDVVQRGDRDAERAERHRRGVADQRELRGFERA